MNLGNICYSCFAKRPAQSRICGACGYDNSRPQISPNCLAKGTVLHDRYVIGKALGVGGFGITYKCLDTKIGGVCAVKEYFPATCSSVRAADGRNVVIRENDLEKYNKIMKRFVEEADLLKSLRHRNVITVYDSFFENKTAYYVMEYCDGIDLRDYTGKFTRQLGYNEGMNIMSQVMDGLEYVHRKGILHRDIAPDNIFVTKNNTVKILDFGSARHEMDQMNRNLSVIVKMGYAPIEQYGKSMQGAYTDVYALGATFYHLFTGRIPTESTQRVASDTMIPFSQLRPDLPQELKYCIERSMAIRPSERVQDIGEMRRMLGLESAANTQYRSQYRTQPQPPQYQPQQRHQSGEEHHSSRSGGALRSQLPLERASISARLCAYMIDVIVYGSAYSAILLLSVEGPETALVLWVMFPLVFMIFNTFTESLWHTTLGKVIMQLTVTSRSGRKPAFSQVLLRNIVKLLGCIGLLFINKNKALEDRVTDTKVCVKK